jgi:hypothetical protein
VTIRPTCHQDRPHCAKGLCRPCYLTRWRRRQKARAWLTLRRECDLCGTSYVPRRRKGRYCSKACLIVACGNSRVNRRGGAGLLEDRYAFRDREAALMIARMAWDRGCRRVTPRYRATDAIGPYFSAWHRGGGLYIVRVRWPSSEEEAAA